MSLLSSLNLKRDYDPCKGNDVVDDFYIPCLKVSSRYDRCSAYFSTAALINVSKGLESFVIKNNGKIRFIFSCAITEDEMINIQNGYEQKMDILADTIDQSALDSREIANLSYLIANGVAEVKIAFMIKSKSAILHSKFGLFYDDENNRVYFFGSGNETAAGLLNNAEIFKVFSNQINDIEDINSGEKMFNDLWDNKYAPNSVRTEYPVGKLFEKLISYNRGKIFSTESEFYEFNNEVLIDVDIDNNLIILKDYTDEKLLSINMIMATNFGTLWKKIDDDYYIVQKLTLYALKEVIIKNLDNYGIKYILSNAAIMFINNYDYELDKRLKLGLSVKTSTNKETWISDYYSFKKIVDSEMVARLKDRQMENAFYHYIMKSSADFSVPGTGKTYISYGLYAYLTSKSRESQEVTHMVVFGPLNCFRARKEEASNIFGNMRNFSIFDVTEHHNDFKNVLETKKFNIYLINYDYVNDEKIKVIAKNIIDENTLVVFDEIHKLKSTTGTRARLFIKLFDICNRKPIFKLALTGTPIPNSFKDIFNCMKILYPDDIFGVLNYLLPENLEKADKNEAAELKVRESLQPVFVRTTKKDLHIPPAEPNDTTSLLVTPNENEELLYKYVKGSYGKNILLLFIRLIQASSNPELLLKALNKADIESCFGDNDIFSDFFNSGSEVPLFKSEIEDIVKKNPNSTKYLATLDKIKELKNQNRKVLVWCLFIDTIDKLKKDLHKLGITATTISGRNSIDVRNQRIDDFKNGKVEVLITNPNTLAESVSLHQICHDAIYLEYGFNLTYLLQSKDRIHRVGLPEGTKTNYYFAITDGNLSEGSIDQHIYKRLSEKADRMIRTIESNDLIPQFDGSDIDDIKAILKGMGF